MKYKKIFMYCVLFTVLGSFFHCDPENIEIKKVEELENPSQEWFDLRLLCYEDDQLIWNLEAGYAKKGLDDSSVIFMKPLKMTFFDSVGNVSNYAEADSGITSQDNSEVAMWGNVLFRNKDSVEVRTQSMKWKKSDKKVSSEDFVEVVRPTGDRIQGKGFEADDQFREWAFLSLVSGEIPEVKRRMDADKDARESKQDTTQEETNE